MPYLGFVPHKTWTNLSRRCFTRSYKILYVIRYIATRQRSTIHGGPLLHKVTEPFFVRPTAWPLRAILCVPRARVCEKLRAAKRALPPQSAVIEARIMHVRLRANSDLELGGMPERLPRPVPGRPRAAFAALAHNLTRMRAKHARPRTRRV